MTRLKAVVLVVACQAGIAVSAAAPPGGAPEGPITIGLFVPSTEGDLTAREMRRGAGLAVDAANREGGVRGRPLRLAVAGAEAPWSGAAGALVRLIDEERAAAIVGAVDGRSAHLAEQVITRARGEAIFVSSWASDETLTRINIPWFFSVVPDDRSQARRLVAEALDSEEEHPAAAWVSGDPAWRAAARAFERAAPAGRVVSFEAGESPGRERLAQALQAGGLRDLVLFCPAVEGAELAVWLRKRGLRPRLHAPLGIATPDLLAPGTAAALEGMRVVAPAGCHGPLRAACAGLREAASSPAALYAHDAVAVVVAALRRSSPSGDRDLAAVLQETSFEGATGTLRFDERRGRDGDPGLAVLASGELVAPAGDRVAGGRRGPPGDAP